MAGRTAKCIECFNIPHAAMELPDQDLQKVVAGLVKTAEGGFPKDSLTSQASIGPFQEAAVMAITAVWCAPPPSPPPSNTCTTARTPVLPNSAETGFQDSMLTTGLQVRRDLRSGVLHLHGPHFRLLELGAFISPLDSTFSRV